jgi:hypothetical protein
MGTLLKTTTGQRNLRETSGEELLLLAVFGPAYLKHQIDHELDRRALTGIAGGTGVVPQPAAVFSGFCGHAA